LPDVMTIADDVDAQLTKHCFPDARICASLH
jgi:hypothetical protein